MHRHSVRGDKGDFKKTVKRAMVVAGDKIWSRRGRNAGG